jgi:hypothetical protein
MTSVFDQLDTIYTGINTNVDDVKSLLRRTKKLHGDAPTRELNQKYNIPSYRFLKREGVIQLVRNNSMVSDERNDAAINMLKSTRLPHTIASDYNLNNEEQIDE